MVTWPMAHFIVLPTIWNVFVRSSLKIMLFKDPRVYFFFFNQNSFSEKYVKITLSDDVFGKVFLMIKSYWVSYILGMFG